MAAGRADISGISGMLEMLPPFAMRVAATLRLSDHIGSQGRTLGELALATGTNADALARLLRYLCTLGLYREPAADRFELAPAGRLLSQRQTGSLREWLDLESAGGKMDLALGGLLHSVRTGEPGYAEVFGKPFWEDMGSSPSFDALMTGKSTRIAPEIAALDFSGVACVADVGGGVGLTLSEILRAHPGLSGVLIEREDTVAQACAAIAEAGLKDRCTVVGADIQHAVPAGADAYLLFDILHNWDDETAETILRNCAKAAGRGGRILIVEDLPQGDRNGYAMDLKMLVLFGGRQRTVGEFTDLAAKAGLGVHAVHELPSGFGVVEARAA